MKHQPIFSCWICKGHPLPGSHLEKMLFQYSFLPAMKFYWFSILIHPTFLIPNFARICLCPWCLLVSVWGRLFYIPKVEELHVSIEKREAEIEILSIPESMGMVALCSQSTADYKAPCRSCVRGECKFWLLLKSKQHFTCAFPLVFETPLTLSSSPFSSCPRWLSSPWWWRSPGRASPWCPAHQRHSPSWRCVSVFLKQTSLIPVNCNFHILIFRHQHLFYSLESVPVQHLLHLLESCPLIIL